jgi:predicted transcriptional regulator
MKMAAAHVPDTILEALDAIAEARGVERTKVIRWALIEYIERHCASEVTVDPSEEQEQVAA